MHDQAEDTHFDAEGLGPQNLNIVRLDVQHHQEEHKGQGDEHHAAEPAFGRQRLDLPKDPITFASDVADFV